jgi:hypothetical protein
MIVCNLVQLSGPSNVGGVIGSRAVSCDGNRPRFSPTVGGTCVSRESVILGWSPKELACR